MITDERSRKKGNTYVEMKSTTNFQEKMNRI